MEAKFRYNPDRPNNRFRPLPIEGIERISFQDQMDRISNPTFNPLKTLVKPIIQKPTSLLEIRKPKITYTNPVKTQTVKQVVKLPPKPILKDVGAKLRLAKTKAIARIRKIKLLAI